MLLRVHLSPQVATSQWPLCRQRPTQWNKCTTSDMLKLVPCSLDGVASYQTIKYIFTQDILAFHWDLKLLNIHWGSLPIKWYKPFKLSLFYRVSLKFNQKSIHKIIWKFFWLTTSTNWPLDKQVAGRLTLQTIQTQKHRYRAAQINLIFFCTRHSAFFLVTKKIVKLTI